MLAIGIALAPILAGAQEATSPCRAGASCVALAPMNAPGSASWTLRLVLLAIVIVAGLAWYGRRRAAEDE